MSGSEHRYGIVFVNRRVKDDWEALSQKFPERIEACRRFLENNPEDRRKAVGILKKLHPPYEGILQYDITKDNYRVWYRVDREKRIVIIKYAGAHPR
jgi:mRNA-degrading endonuclease RelE of RelBE toxin-antitoxin system